MYRVYLKYMNFARLALALVSLVMSLYYFWQGDIERGFSFALIVLLLTFTFFLFRSFRKKRGL